MTVKDIYNSGEYNLVLKLVYHNMDVDELTTWLLAETRNREGEKMTLGDLVAWLQDIAKPREIRISTSFAAVDWASPTSWGQYSWPYKTLAKYGLDKTEGIYLRVEPGDIVKRALPTLYKGFGIAVLDKELKMGEWLEEEARPLLVFLDSKFEPKKNVVFIITETEPGKLGGYALVSSESVVPILQEHGFEAPEILEPNPGVRVYTLRLSRVFESRYDLDSYLRSLHEILNRHGFLLFRHDTIGMEGLPEKKVERLVEG